MNLVARNPDCFAETSFAALLKDCEYDTQRMAPSRARPPITLSRTLRRLCFFLRAMPFCRGANLVTILYPPATSFETDEHLLPVPKEITSVSFAIDGIPCFMRVLRAGPWRSAPSSWTDRLSELNAENDRTQVRSARFLVTAGRIALPLAFRQGCRERISRQLRAELALTKLSDFITDVEFARPMIFSKRKLAAAFAFPRLLSIRQDDSLSP